MSSLPVTDHLAILYFDCFFTGIGYCALTILDENCCSLSLLISRTLEGLTISMFVSNLIDSIKLEILFHSPSE